MVRLHYDLINFISDYLPKYVLQPWIHCVITYSNWGHSYVYDSKLVIINDKLPKEIKKYIDPRWTSQCEYNSEEELATLLKGIHWKPTQDNINDLEYKLSELGEHAEDYDDIYHNADYNIEIYELNIYEDQLIFKRHKNKALNILLINIL